MKTMVYVKMDAPDQLLLSEGVCRQLGIVTYHPSLLSQDTAESDRDDSSLVPSVRVRLPQSLKILPSQCAVVSFRVEGELPSTDQNLSMEGHKALGRNAGVIVEDALMPLPKEGLIYLVVTNLS